MLFAYSITKKDPDTLTPQTNVTTASIASNEPMYQGWNKHTINFAFQYDVEKDNNRCVPSIQLSYNKTIGGKRVFKGKLWGGQIGLDIALKF